jgi:hypothetical protein
MVPGIPSWATIDEDQINELINKVPKIADSDIKVEV